MKTTLKVYVLWAVILLVGCTPTKTKLAGSDSYLIDCSKSGEGTLTTCFEEANRTCPNGYTIDNIESDDAYMSRSRSVVISCNSGD